MNEFCRIIPVDNGQVLLMLSWNDDEDESPYEVEQTTEYNGTRMTIKAGYDSEDKWRNHFNTFTTEDAQTFFNTAKQMLGE